MPGRRAHEGGRDLDEGEQPQQGHRWQRPPGRRHPSPEPRLEPDPSTSGYSRLNRVDASSTTNVWAVRYDTQTDSLMEQFYGPRWLVPYGPKWQR